MGGGDGSRDARGVGMGHGGEGGGESGSIGRVTGPPGRRPAEPEVDDERQQGHHHEDDDERDDDGDDAAVVVRAGPGEAAQAQHHDQSPDGSGVCADAIWTWAGTAWTGMSTRVSIRPPAGSGTTGRTGG